jgi:hypothetical protein
MLRVIYLIHFVDKAIRRLNPFGILQSIEVAPASSIARTCSGSSTLKKTQGVRKPSQFLYQLKADVPRSPARTYPANLSFFKLILDVGTWN